MKLLTLLAVLMAFAMPAAPPLTSRSPAYVPAVPSGERP